MATLDNPQVDVAAIVPAAGVGARLGSGLPKALRLLGDEPLLAHAVRRLAAAGSVGCLAVAAPPGREATVRELVTGALPPAGRPEVVVVAGGAERQQSVATALAALPVGIDIVLVHDAARALAPTSLVEQVATAVRAGCDAVIPVLPVTDTITRVDSAGQALGHLDRSALRAVQTPQGFRRAVLARAHLTATGGTATDDAGLVTRLGVPVHTIPGSDHALKITTQLDLALARTLLG